MKVPEQLLSRKNFNLNVCSGMNTVDYVGVSL